jgi:hypothetical protein
MIDNMAGDGRKNLSMGDVGLENESAATESVVDIFIDETLTGGC